MESIQLNSDIWNIDVIVASFKFFWCFLFVEKSANSSKTCAATIAFCTFFTVELWKGSKSEIFKTYVDL